MTAQYAKAIAAACTAAAGTIGTAIVEGGISGGEWALIVLGTVAAAALVFAVPNKTPPAS